MKITANETEVLPVIETYITKKPKLKKSLSISVISNKRIEVAGEVFRTKTESKKIIQETVKKNPNTTHVPFGIMVVYCCNA